MGIAENAGKVILGGVMNSPPARVVKIITHTGGLSGKADQALEATVALDTAENAINIGGKISPSDKEKAQQKIKEMIAAEASKPCKPNDPNCNKQKHNGRIQAQNGATKDPMIVKAVDANSNWVDHPSPPTFALCSLYAKSVRVKMLGLTGHSPDKKKGQNVKYEKGATIAYNNLIKWMKENTGSGGVGPSKWSFSFDGTHKQDRVFGDSRRIDIDVRTGLILKS